MPINTADYSKYAAIVVSLLTLGYTIWKDRKTDKRMKKIEREQEREKTEAANRRSKASAPYYSPSKKPLANVYETDEGEIRIWPAGAGNVLSIRQPEIPKDAPEKTPILLVLDTGGKGARRITISGDIPDLQIKQEPDISEAEGLVFLKYPYSPSQHGKTQRVVFVFETEDGFELTHVYETRHGCFEFNRVDPK